MDSRLNGLKQYPRAMKPYVLTLYEIIRENKPEKVLEIGVQNGISTKTILTAMGANGNGKLISVDHKHRETILDADFSDLKDRWKLIVGNSHDQNTITEVVESLSEEEKFDILFIDGDHKMPGIQQDWEAYTPLVKSGGIILMHDIINPNEEVSQVWDKITWEKFAFTWGLARNRIPVGFGIVRKP